MRRAAPLALLLAAALLPLRATAQTPCMDDRYEPDDTQGQAKPIAVGERQTHLHCNPDWVRLVRPVGADALFVAETSSLSGGADTTLEVDQLHQGDGFSHYEVIARDDDGGEGKASRIVFATGSHIGVFEAGDRYGDGKSYDISVRCITGCAPLGDVLYVPAVVHLRGRFGAFFQSDLVLGNPGAAPVDVELVLTPGDTDGRSNRTSRHLTVGPGRTLELVDVVGNLFGMETSGSLEVRPLGGNVTATSRLYDAASRGAALQVLSAERLVNSAASGDVLHLVALSGSADERTNVAFTETTGGHATVTLSLFDRSGAPLGERRYFLSPWGHHQVNDVFAELGVPPQVDARATLTATGSGRILGYATVVGNGTAGISYRPAVRGERYALTVPVTSLGTAQRTDLRIVNLGEKPDLFRVQTRPREGPGVSLTLSAAPGETLVVSDVLQSAGGLISVTHDPSTFLDARPFAAVGESRASGAPEGPSGTIVGRPGDNADRLIFPLTSTQGRRFALSFAEAPFFPVVVDVSLHSKDGRLLALQAFRLPGYLHDSGALLELPDASAALGASGCEGCRIRVDLPSAGPVFAWGSLVDDVSGAVAQVLPFATSKVEELRTVTLPGGVPMSFVAVPAIESQIGSPAEEAGRDADEMHHVVRVTRPYLLGSTEVTEAQWDAVMGGTRASALPVTNVSWLDVAGPGGFLERLAGHLAGTGQDAGGALRLPTEAEWELAARGITYIDTPFPHLVYGPPCAGSCDACPFLEGQVWWCGHGGRTAHPVGLGGAGTTRGLHDMLGNVWEWVADRYAPFTAEPAVDPSGPASGDGRVIRGGGFDSELRLCRSANRYAYPPDGRYPNVGFRVAATLTLPTAAVP